MRSVQKKKKKKKKKKATRVRRIKAAVEQHLRAE